MSQKVDGRIITKIQDLVGEGVRNVKEMERHLKIYVKDLFRDAELPSIENRRFYPRRQDIRNHMYIAAVKTRLAKMDQENLKLKIEKWKQERPNDLFHFRSYGSARSNDSDLNSEESNMDDTVNVSTLCSFSIIKIFNQTGA